MIQFKMLWDGPAPKKAYRDDAGWDIYSPVDIIFKPHEYKWFGLGLAVKIPKGYGAQIITRSSFTNKGLFSSPSFIDSGYLNEIHFAGINLLEHEIEVKKGERMCSLIIYKLTEEKLERVEKFDEELDRRFAGSGSSGK